MCPKTSIADPGCSIPDPGSGSLNFHPGSYCTKKEGGKIKLTFSLLLTVWFQEQVLLFIKGQRFLRKSHQKHTGTGNPLDPGSGKKSSPIRIPEVKKHRIRNAQTV
jgi:hypothetical protein